MIDVAILGFGNRGTLYADILRERKDARVAAICDVDAKRLKAAAGFGVSGAYLTTDVGEFLEKKRGDMLIVSTLDGSHYAQAMRGLELGYDILLEKPISNSLSECLEIEAKAKQTGRRVAVSHVLRYTAFYEALKEVIDSGRIGEIVTVTQTENVGYFHQAHSYVRGPWRRKDETSPMILAKCSHDLDILYWLIDKKPVSLSSYGSLYFFNEAHAPKGSGKYCFECAAAAECPYENSRFYKKNPGWFNAVRAKSEPVKAATADEEIDLVLKDKNNPFSRCVFRCDNDVVDHQAVNILFEGGVTAQLIMTAFSEKCTRTVKVHGTYGEIVGDFEERRFTVTEYGKESETIDIAKRTEDFSGHGGGDQRMLSDFIGLLKGDAASKGLTGIEHSVLSHRMAFKAEDSRLSGGMPVKLSANN